MTTPIDVETTRPAQAVVRPVLMKGNEAIAEAAIQAGCDAYFGYPITPQAELLEWMARRMPELGRAFVQAESELAAINMALGAAATGARVLVSSSSPGMSLMAEAMSYLAGSELPIVLVNVMRGGPGLGSIGPSQSDYFQATKGHGHGDYRVPVLAPSSIAEAVELTADAFEIAERYRTPVIILADGVMGQAMEPVVPVYRLPARKPGSWELSGPPAARRGSSAPFTSEARTSRRTTATCSRSSRRSPSARPAGRASSSRTLSSSSWPTGPRHGSRGRRSSGRASRACASACSDRSPCGRSRRPSWRTSRRRCAPIVVLEMSAGQMVEDVRLAVEGRTPVLFHGRTGGMVPTPAEVVDVLRRAWALTPPNRASGPDGSDDEDEPDPLSLIEQGAWADARRDATDRTGR